MDIVKKIFICVFGPVGWGFLTLFIWVAFLYGGQEGYVILAFNLFGEMIFELFLITGVFILMLVSSFHVLSKESIENEDSLDSNLLTTSK